MNVMNVMNMWKSAMFMPYPIETKGRLNVMNVVPKYFACGARVLPNHGVHEAALRRASAKLCGFTFAPELKLEG
jgi:hypothetical protein